jgi:hypothetical protein
MALSFMVNIPFRQGSDEPGQAICSGSRVRTLAFDLADQFRNDFSDIPDNTDMGHSEN